MDTIEFKKLTEHKKYDLLSEYKGSKIKCLFNCNKHGNFELLPGRFLKYDIPCGECRKDINIYKQKNMFINNSNDIHNFKYDYSKVSYSNNKIEVEIICPVHGSFYKRPDIHIYQKQGCPDCYFDTIETKDTFIFKSNKIHNFKYDYSLIDKISKIVDIKCKKHGIFKQNIYNHMNGQGCPDCCNSKGENIIERYLIENNILYIKQKKFSDCINKRCLPFDFYLPDYNTCIEYDGVYHYTSDYIKNNDEIKNNYCLNKKIKLLRFNLSNINNLDFIINIYK